MKARTLVVAAWLAACHHSEPTSPKDIAIITSLEFRSDSGDYVGQGLTYRYTLANAAWLARLKPYSSGAYLSVSVFAPAGTTPFWSWDLVLAPRQGQPITVVLTPTRLAGRFRQRLSLGSCSMGTAAPAIC